MTYAAFISYSHAADGRLAPALQYGLQRFAKPWNKMRALRVFRDEASLSVNPSLWPSIEQALGDAEYFILMASPDAANSEWVQMEVEYWISNEEIDHLLIALTDGDLLWNAEQNDFDWNEETPLPPSLQDKFNNEPRYLDLRWARNPDEHLSLDHNRFREAVADLAATLHNRPKDELIGEEVREHAKGQRFRRLATTGLVVFAFVAAIAAGLAGYQSIEAERQRDFAQEQERIAKDQEKVAKENERIAKKERNEALAAQSRALAALSRLATDTDNATLGMLLALEALPENVESANRPYVRSAEAALLHAIAYQRELRIFQGHKDLVWHAAFSPDGARVVTASSDNTARLWDAVTGEPLATLEGHKDLVWHAAFSPDGARLVTASEDHTARLWDVSVFLLSDQALIDHARKIIPRDLTTDERRNFSLRALEP